MLKKYISNGNKIYTNGNAMRLQYLALPIFLTYVLSRNADTIQTDMNDSIEMISSIGPK
jgi:hypothetical protein